MTWLLQPRIMHTIRTDPFTCELPDHGEDLFMSAELDHVFVCCAGGAPVAASLTQVSFVEGSSNTHPGQGTANRVIWPSRDLNPSYPWTIKGSASANLF
jgi:hypothetical protein